VFGGLPTSSGERITSENAINIGVVYACVDKRAKTIAKMPIHLYKKTDKGKERIENNISELLNVRPNQYFTPYVFKHCISSHVDLWGNAYVWIEADRNGKPTSLWLLRPDITTTYLDTDTGILWYITNLNGKSYKFRSDEIIHLKSLSIDGIVGKSKITVARETLGNISASQKILGKFYNNGTTSSGVISYPEELDKKAKDNIRSSWMSANSGLDNAGKVAILDMGLKYDSIGTSFEDAQFIQLSRFTVEEVARIMDVPLHMIKSMESSTFNNVEHQNQDFITNSIQPELTQWEEEFNYKILSKLQRKQGIFAKFNMESALRGDSTSRASFYEKMLNLGVYNINDVRELEDRNTIGEAGDKHRVSLNFVDVEIADEYQLSKARSSETKEGR
jgi:HK97 family phage portal protein